MATVEEENRYLKMSEAERKRQRELLDFADKAAGASLDVVAAAALKWALNHLKGAKPEDNKLGKAFDSVNVQSLPREALLGKPANLSETQIEDLKRKAVDALTALAKV